MTRLRSQLRTALTSKKGAQAADNSPIVQKMLNDIYIQAQKQGNSPEAITRKILAELDAPMNESDLRDFIIRAQQKSYEGQKS